MSASRRAPPGGRRYLEPTERISEALFGLIMVLTFTGSFSAAEAGHAEVRTMLLGAIGCSVAWGLIDAIMYVMGCVAERAERTRLLIAVRDAADPGVAHQAIADALPEVVSSAARPADLEGLRQAILRIPAPPGRVRFTMADWLGALFTFLWVVVIAIPVVLPFLVVEDPRRALRVSSAVAIALLFVMGYLFGRYARLHALATGVAMVLVGASLVALTIALGG